MSIQLHTKPDLSKLRDGKIPPHTICPFHVRCDHHCWHQDHSHEVPYSCPTARAFDFHQGLGLDFGK